LSTNYEVINEEVAEYGEKNESVYPFASIIRGGFIFSLDCGAKYVTIGNTHKYGNKEETLAIEHKEG